MYELIGCAADRTFSFFDLVTASVSLRRNSREIKEKNMRTSDRSHSVASQTHLVWAETKHPDTFSRLRLLTILLIVLFAIPQLTLAQSTGAIQGHVSDGTGASVPKALIKATNESTGVYRTAYSADDGYYRIADLLPGIYVLRVELAGFRTIIKHAVEVTADSMAGLNFALEVGEVTQTIDVTGSDTQVETEVARISDVINDNQIKALPIQGRGVLNLAVLTPGIQGKAEPLDVISTGYFCCDAFSNYKSPDISTGGTENKSHYTLDGLSLRYFGGSYWGALFSPNVDAVEEVRISTNPSLAETGTISGPQVNFVTKGGTNDWHGTAHFSNIDSALNAKPFFATEKLPSHTRYYGGTAGGPLVKNRLFVFGGYQGVRERTVPSSLDFVETKAFRDFVVNTRLHLRSTVA